MKRHLSIFLILVTFVLSHVTGMKWISVIRSLATKSAKLYKLNQQPGFCSGSVTSTNFLQQSFRIINSKTFLILISLPSPLHFSWIVVGAQIRLNIQKEAMQWQIREAVKKKKNCVEIFHKGGGSSPIHTFLKKKQSWS